MAAGTGDVPRDQLLLELSRLPGQTRQHQVSHRGEEERLRAYAERFGTADRQNARGHPRELSERGWVGAGPRSAAAVYEGPRENRALLAHAETRRRICFSPRLRVSA